MKNAARVVRILNPRQGEATYTTVRRATDLVQLNIAVYEEAGIRFIDDSVTRRCIRAEREASILADRQGYIWWSGCLRQKPGRQNYIEPGQALLPASCFSFLQLRCDFRERQGTRMRMLP